MTEPRRHDFPIGMVVGGCEIRELGPHAGADDLACARIEGAALAEVTG